MHIEEIVRLALKEDIGDGDHTSLATIPEDATGEAVLTAKDQGIIAGIDVAREVFRQVDSTIRMNVLMDDGSTVKKGDKIFYVSGKARSLLTAERTALNFLQRMSGIATFTRKLANQLEGYPARLLDTRKTTACNRTVEKMAVRLGGGHNHRFGLFDMIMIKDNHVDFSGGIEKAIEATHNYLKSKGKNLKIEIEVRNFDELDEVLRVGGVNRIMLDNFTPDDLKKAVDIIGGAYETEASGNISIDNIRKYAETGVDFISVGALTHQIKSLDLSLKAI
ncbi:MAG: carboxylating nicotinate-nucleotide diphosphorylase [Bacteroidetes bacterium]|nr:MAG: carboxylating nicotinate-nucleotide diphosphorylase [Bacteroidota bacterium]RLD70318.1 MAG: carboxylating nicotinate-nucleotide diphosphorylase [Bacteroidota bacterium]RLD88485.1 MAG: carboxylating nicotinate-nucleotide diphosphorylase [Bacteroidota bacterium]